MFSFPTPNPGQSKERLRLSIVLLHYTINISSVLNKTDVAKDDEKPPGLTSQFY